MLKRIFLLIIVSLIVTSCARVRDSRINPFNWFGNDRSQAIQVDKTVVVDYRNMVDQVTSLSVDRQPGGAIVRARGLPQTQGFWNAELVALNDGKAVKGTLSFEFRVAPPVPGDDAISTPQSREIIVGLYLSDFKLEDVRRIEVIGAQNRRSVRR